MLRPSLLVIPLVALACSATPPAASLTPDASSPDVSVADVSAPEVSLPDASAPDASAPDAPRPDVTLPDASLPDAPAARCAGRTLGPGDWERTVTVGGVVRTYRVHVPRGYDPTAPAQVVMNFHGYLSSETQQADWSNLNEAADARNFIAVHPRGRDASWNAGVCCGLAQSRNDDDLGFVRAMLDRLDAELCVDPRRVFSTGFSNGAFFSHRLACELAARVAAIAPVSGDNTIEPCAPGRPVPVLHFHGDADLVVPYNGSPALRFPSALDSARGWARRNGCADTSTVTFDRGDTRCVTFDRCPADGEVTLCTIRGGGHTWPGGDVPLLGGYTGRSLDATTAMLDFFARHPR